MAGDPNDVGSSVPLPIEIVESVAHVLGTDTIELPPMHDYVDLEAVERLVESADGTGDSVTVRFEYQGLHVEVSPDGVETRPVDGEQVGPPGGDPNGNEPGSSTSD